MSTPEETAAALDPHARALLDFERQWWTFGAGKEEAITARFEISASDYYRDLNALLDSPAALAHDPLLVRRLRRLRRTRQRQRSARRGPQPPA